jgi:hypothetical protein
VIDKADTRTLDSFVRQMVSDRVSLLATDEHSGYRHLGEAYPHHVIRKSRQTTWSGAVHTNTIEAYWSIFKRGIVRSFHKAARNTCHCTSRSSNSATTPSFRSRHSTVLRRNKSRRHKRKRPQ